MPDDEAIKEALRPLPDEAEATPAPEPAEDGATKEPEASPEPEPVEDEAKDPDEVEAEAAPDDGEKPKRRRTSRRDRRVSRLQAEVDALKAALTAPQKQDAPADAPKVEDFTDYEDYQSALVKHEVAKTIAEEREMHRKADEQRRQNERQSTMAGKVESLLEAGTGAHPDFEQVFHDDVPVSNVMSEALLESENGHEVAYYLGSNPDESERISRMSPLAAVRELTLIEARLTGPLPRKTSNAPEPPKRVGGKQSAPAKSPVKMSYPEYKAAREAGKIR